MTASAKIEVQLYSVKVSTKIEKLPENKKKL